MAHNEQRTIHARKGAWGIAAMFLLGLALPASAHRIEKRFAVQLHPVVTVRNTHGKITVRPWQKSEVLVVAEHASEKVETDAEQMGNRVDVSTHLLSEDVTTPELRADYEISVPAETELQIRTDAGTIFVKGISGDMTFDTVAADISLEEVAGYLVIKTVGGSLECVRCAGRIDANSVSGNLRLLRPVSSNVRLQTHSGSIFFDGEFLRGGVYILTNRTGPIDVRFSDDDSFNLSASSVRGEVENQAMLKPPLHARRATPSGGMSKSLFGTLNEGLARVDLSSFSGTIRIVKRQ